MNCCYNLQLRTWDMGSYACRGEDNLVGGCHSALGVISIAGDLCITRSYQHVDLVLSGASMIRRRLTKVRATIQRQGTSLMGST